MRGRPPIVGAPGTYRDRLPGGDDAWLRRSAGLRSGPAGHRIALTRNIAEISRLNGWVEDCCRDAGIARDTAFKVKLALEETVANVIQHAFRGIPAPHRIKVQLDIAAACVTAVVTDNGRPFDPSTASEPDVSLPLERRHPGGLGILLLHRMVDRIEYHRTGGRNRLRLEKDRG